MKATSDMVADRESITFGQFIRDQRRFHGRTQTAVADGIGINQATLARWESGARVPQEEYLPRLATELRVSFAEILQRYQDSVDDVERAILASRLTHKEQDALLAMYGVLSGRASLDVHRQTMDGRHEGDQDE
jgi:transcriptional regulator with XRE-family HTH domain